MKKMIALLVVLGVAACCQAQTALYKHFMNRNDMMPICIEDFPLNDTQKVDITMLMITDSASLQRVLNELHQMPRTKTGNSYKFNTENAVLEKACNNGDTAYILPSRNDMDQISKELVVDQLVVTTNSKHLFSFFKIDALPGDTGCYLVYHSKEKLAILIYHCPDMEIYQQVIRYTIERHKNSK